VLADLGARVIKVERPETGDDARSVGPFASGRSAYFASLNRGKESIALDLERGEDRAVFEALLARADVLVENFRPGAMDRLGYGWEPTHARFPGLVYAAISGFGRSGPYARRSAYDVIVQAMGGVMSLTGQPGGPPTRVGTSIGDIAAGLFAAIGIAAALHHRAATGEGALVDVAMLDAQVAILENAIARYLATGEVPGPLGSRHPSIAPFAAFAARDGHLAIAAGTDALFRKLALVLGRPALAADSRFASNALRVANVGALHAELEAALAERPAVEWIALLLAAGVPCGPLQDVAQVLADPQVAARNMVIRAGGAAMAGNPVKLSSHADPAERAPAPDLDEHGAAIRRELGLGRD
jgi:CoA:oxalate CoA-transferase